MRPLILLEQAREQLRNAGSRYRIRRHPKGLSPFVIVYETKGAKRTKTVRGCRCDDARQLAVLVGYLLAAPASGLNWALLDTFRVDGDEVSLGQLTWGELRALVQSWCASGGIKARDRNAFDCFGPNGYFARHLADDVIARPGDLEEFCLYTVASRDAYRQEPRRALQLFQYNSRGFYDAVQMINFLAKQDFSITTPQPVAYLLRLEK